MKPGANCKRPNLLLFPRPAAAPVSAEDLRRNSRLLLELGEIRVELEHEQRLLANDWMRWKKRIKSAKEERNALLEGLARGAKLASIACMLLLREIVAG